MHSVHLGTLELDGVKVPNMGAIQRLARRRLPHGGRRERLIDYLLSSRVCVSART
jgi:hypothetical protein